MKRKKQLKDETIEATNTIKQVKAELFTVEQELVNKRKELKCKVEQNRRLDAKVCRLFIIS